MLCVTYYIYYTLFHIMTVKLPLYCTIMGILMYMGCLAFFIFIPVVYFSAEAARINITHTIKYPSTTRVNFEIMDPVSCGDTMNTYITCMDLTCANMYQLYNVYDVKCDCIFRYNCNNKPGYGFVVFLAAISAMVMILAPVVEVYHKSRKTAITIGAQQTIPLYITKL
jgi:hypothetical protein